MTPLLLELVATTKEIAGVETSCALVTRIYDYVVPEVLPVLVRVLILTTGFGADTQHLVTKTAPLSPSSRRFPTIPVTWLGFREWFWGQQELSQY